MYFRQWPFKRMANIERGVMKLKRPTTMFIPTKRCVFCDGNKTEVIEGEFFKSKDHLYYVACNKPSCMASGPMRKTRNGAIQKWNKIYEIKT